jgi:hypothetical protein
VSISHFRESSTSLCQRVITFRPAASRSGESESPASTRSTETFERERKRRSRARIDLGQHVIDHHFAITRHFLFSGDFSTSMDLGARSGPYRCELVRGGEEGVSFVWTIS